MQKMTDKAIMARVAFVGLVTGAFDRLRSDERGQGSVEYVGIIVVVVAIITALVVFGPQIGDAIGGILQNEVEEVGNL
ncbi:MAG: hypothetical protein ACTMIR_11080 [Cellulomonadaceae bacterium]